jgi:hypothetical protein
MRKTNPFANVVKKHVGQIFSPARKFPDRFQTVRQSYLFKVSITCAHACDKCDKCDITCNKCNKCDIACNKVVRGHEEDTRHKVQHAVEGDAAPSGGEATAVGCERPHRAPGAAPAGGVGAPVLRQSWRRRRMRRWRGATDGGGGGHHRRNDDDGGYRCGHHCGGFDAAGGGGGEEGVW